jgi:hypothetical protein
MGMKTVRMEPEDEKLLARIQRRTGWTASDVLKRGMRLLDKSLATGSQKSPYEIYTALDLGAGSDAIESASDSRNAARRAILRKHGK